MKVLIESKKKYAISSTDANGAVRCDPQCDFCYEERIRVTAKFAKEHEYEAFSTTLLISPYQKHDRLKQICEKIAIEEKIPFVYTDLRSYFREGQKRARELPLYMQKYCGCIFSEEERYLKKKV